MDRALPRGAPRRIYHEPPREVRALGRVASDGVAWSVDGSIAWANDRLVEIAGRIHGLVGTKLEDLLLDKGDGLPGEGGSAECEIERPNGERSAVVCPCAQCDPKSGT